MELALKTDPKKQRVQLKDEVVEVRPKSEDLDFKKVLDKSKENVRRAQADKLEKSEKRGRGRPPKHRESRRESPPEIPLNDSLSAPTPAPNLAPMIIAPLKMVSKIPAVKYNIPELALSDEEANMCAESLNALVQAFVPDTAKMDPKTAAVISSCAVFGSIGFQKWQIFKAKAVQVKTDDLLPPEPAKPEEAPLTSDAYFRTQAMGPIRQ